MKKIWPIPLLLALSVLALIAFIWTSVALSSESSPPLLADQPLPSATARGLLLSPRRAGSIIIYLQLPRDSRPMNYGLSAKRIRRAFEFTALVDGAPQECAQIQSSGDDLTDGVNLTALNSDGVRPIAVNMTIQPGTPIPSDSRLIAFHFMDQNEWRVEHNLLGITRLATAILTGVFSIAAVILFVLRLQRRKDRLTEAS